MSARFKVAVLAAVTLLAFLAAACGDGREDSLAVGDPAPDFALPAAGGGQVALGDYLGKTNVLLYFNMAYG